MTLPLNLLELGAGAFTAYRSGIAVAGNNVANAATEGYSRQTLDYRAALGSDGVRTGSPARVTSPWIVLRERTAAADHGRASSLASASVDLEAQLTPERGNLVQAIAALFGGILDLSASPSDPTLRQATVGLAADVSTAFTTVSEAIERSVRDAENRIAAMVREASNLAEQIAQANAQMHVTSDAALADTRDLAARRLADLVGGEARIDPDGMMRVTVGGGAVLVDGTRAASLSAEPDPALGGRLAVRLRHGGTAHDLSSSIDRGQLGGELAFRDGVGAQARADVDALARDLADAFNAVHGAHVALDGSGGRPLFAYAPGQAAATLAVDPEIAADPSLLAAAAPPGDPGNNAGLLALAGLRDQAIAGGGQRTLVDEAIRSIGSVGFAARQAEAARALSAQRVDLAAAARDGLMGVSTEEEMARIAGLQHAAEAATRFIGVVDELMATLLAEI